MAQPFTQAYMQGNLEKILSETTNYKAESLDNWYIISAGVALPCGQKRIKIGFRN